MAISDRQLLDALSQTPFVDSSELALILAGPHATGHRILSSLLAEGIVGRYVAEFQDFLKDGTIPERKALIRNFVEGIEVLGDEATLTYTVPMPSDGATSESASVLDFVKSSPPEKA